MAIQQHHPQQYQQSQQYTPPNVYETPRLGQRSYKTLPMNRRPLTDQSQILTRDLCTTCNGHGTISGKMTVCRVCKRPWWDAEVIQHGRKGIRSTMLPCTHTFRTRDIMYERPGCPTCYQSIVGAGYLPLWITWQEFVTTLYPDADDEQTTAALRVISRTSEKHGHHDAFYQSSPTAPPVHIPLAPQPHHQRDGNNISPISPHMTPLAPVPPTPRFLEALGNGNLSGSGEDNWTNDQQQQQQRLRDESF